MQREWSLASTRFPANQFFNIVSLSVWTLTIFFLTRFNEGEFSLESTENDCDRSMLRIFPINFTDSVYDFLRAR